MKVTLPNLVRYLSSAPCPHEFALPKRPMKVRSPSSSLLGEPMESRFRLRRRVCRNPPRASQVSTVFRVNLPLHRQTVESSFVFGALSVGILLE